MKKIISAKKEKERKSKHPIIQFMVIMHSKFFSVPLLILPLLVKVSCG
jgi:hypothetical protein